MPTRQAIVPIAAFALFAALVSACGGSDGTVESAPRTTNKAPTAATTSPPGTVAPTADDVTLAAYLLRGGKLATAHRRVAPTTAVARAALEQLLAGPNAAESGAGLTTSIPAGTHLVDVNIADGVATVTLSPTVTAKPAVAQIVATLTQFPTVSQVRIGTGGQPLGRADLTDTLPNILVESVAPGDTVTSPVTVSGANNTFESNVVVRVLGADRRVLATVPTTGTGGPGTWGPFRVAVPFDRGTDARGFVTAYDTSAKDGSVIDLVEIPVNFG